MKEGRRKEIFDEEDMRLAGTAQFTSAVINYDLQCSTHHDADDLST